MDRLNKIKEAKVVEEIEHCKENYQVERQISEKIVIFINKRTAEIQKVSDLRDKTRESEISKLLDSRQIVIT